MSADTALPSHPKPPGALHRALPGLVLLGLMVALYFPSVSSLVSQWQAHYGQGYLIALISAGLLWRERFRLEEVAIKPAPLGAVGLLAIGVLLKLAQLLSVEIAENYLLFLTVIAGVLTLYGWAFLKAVAFPLTFLFLALPLHSPPVTWLQDVTAGISVFLLQAMGVPVVWEGYLLHIPAGDFEVAETCAGWRFLQATFPLALLYAYFTYNSFRRRALFMIAALAVAVLANGFRAAGVIGLGQFLGIEAEIVQDHYSWGWFVYFFAMLLLFSLGRRWAEPETAGRETHRKGSDGKIGYGTTVIAAVALAVAPLVPFPATDGAADVDMSIGTPYEELSGSPVANWRPAFIGVSEDTQLRLTVDGSIVDVYAGAFLVGGGSDYTSSSQQMFSPPWQRVAEHSVGPEWPLRELIIERRGLRRIVWYAYCAQGRCVGSRLEAKVLEAKALLEGTPGVGIVALSTLAGLQADAARANLRKVWNSLVLEF